MSLEKIIKEALDKNPLEMKDAFAEEMQSRIAAALEEKYESAMQEDLEEAKDDDDDEDEDDDDDDDDDDDSDDAKIGADMKKLNASCSKTEMYGKMREKYGCSKGKFEGLYASYCESVSEDELLDMIESMSEDDLVDMVESVSDETLEEGPFKGIGKMMMKRKLAKSNKKLGKARDAVQNKRSDDYGDHWHKPKKLAKMDKDISDYGSKMRRTDKAYDRLDREDSKVRNAKKNKRELPFKAAARA